MTNKTNVNVRCDHFVAVHNACGSVSMPVSFATGMRTYGTARFLQSGRFHRGNRRAEAKPVMKPLKDL